MLIAGIVELELTTCPAISRAVDAIESVDDCREESFCATIGAGAGAGAGIGAGDTT